MSNTATHNRRVLLPQDLRRLPPTAPHLPRAVVPAFFAVFLLLDWASFIHPLQHLNITPWNPQPAVAVALLLVERRLWWLVLLSLLAADVLVRDMPVSSFVDLVTATALTGSYLVIARWIRLALPDGWRIGSPRDVALTVGIIASGALLSGVAYVGVLSAAGMVSERPLWEALARYWVGDVVGMVVALPLVLAAMDPEQRQRLLLTLRDWRWWCVAATVGLLLVGLWRAGPEVGMDFSYLLLLPMVWGATRFGAPGALLTAGITQVGLIVAVRAVQREDLIVFELQLLMAAVTITGLLLGVVVDKLQRADHELRRSLRLAAAGQMSAALAHELGQPLTALASYAQACKMLLQGSAPLTAEDQAQLTDVARRMGEDTMRAGEIIRRLRDFFRHGAAEVQPTDLGTLVNDALLAQAQRAQSLGVRVTNDWPAGIPPVMVGRVQMDVVLRNLVANAIEAASVAGHAGSMTVRGSAAGQLVLIEVLDDGPGLTADDCARVFEGVASEKPGGMGIGLSISRAIAEAHGGRLWAEAGPHGHFCLTPPLVSGRNEASTGEAHDGA